MDNQEVANVANKAADNPDLLSKYVQEILSHHEKTRYFSFQVLHWISKNRPELLVSHWDLFTGFLLDTNAFRRHIAVRILANLVSVDHDDKFERIFEQYYSLLNDSVIVAGHVTGNSWKIVLAKPHLETKITEKLLHIDDTLQKHKDLIKSGAIDSFSKYFKKAKNQQVIRDFVAQQLSSTSPKTKKKAKEFMKQWEK
jgi:hypothetical protein